MEKQLSELRAEKKEYLSRKGEVQHRLQQKLAQRRAIAENQVREEEGAAFSIEPFVEIPPADQGTVQIEDQRPVITKARQRLPKHGAAGSENPAMENIGTGAVKKAQEPDRSDADPEHQNIATGAKKKKQKQPSNRDAVDRQTKHFEAAVSAAQPDKTDGGHADVEDEVRLNAI